MKLKRFLWTAIGIGMTNFFAYGDVADKVTCGNQDNKSAESLIRTIIACQNVGRSQELLPLFFLATDQHDQMMNINIQEDGKFTVGSDDEPFNFPLNEWRRLIKISAEVEDRNYQNYRLAQQLEILQKLSEQRGEQSDIDTIILPEIKVPTQMKLIEIGDFIVESENIMPKLGQDITIGQIDYKGEDISQDPPESLSNTGHVIKINDLYFLFTLPI